MLSLNVCVLMKSGTVQIVWCEILPVNGIGNQTLLSLLLVLGFSLLLSRSLWFSLTPSQRGQLRSFKLHPSRLDSVAVEPPHRELSFIYIIWCEAFAGLWAFGISHKKSKRVIRQSILPRSSSCFQMDLTFQFQASFKY